jgi:putative FmdB family regulatory protein
MPIYEYRCRKGHDFEVRQRFADEPLSTCEVCGAAVQRVFRPPAVHFKGSGFYNTDYGTRQRSREMKEAKEASSSESSKDGAKKSESGATKSDSGAKKSETTAAKASD